MVNHYNHIILNMGNDQSRLVTYSEAAELVGKSIPTIRRVVARERVKKQRLNGKVYIQSSDIQGCFETDQENNRSKYNQVKSDLPSVNSEKEIKSNESALRSNSFEDNLVQKYIKVINDQDYVINQRNNELQQLKYDHFVILEQTNTLIRELQSLQQRLITSIKHNQKISDQ